MCACNAHNRFWTVRGAGVVEDMDILAARKKAAERLQEQKQEQKQAEEAQPAPTAAPLSPEPEPETASVVPAPPAPQEEPSSLLPPPDSLAPPQPEPLAEAAEQSDQPAPEAAMEQQVQEVEMLSFRLGGEEYALMVEDVKEVLKNRELTQVPNAPEYILGVTALRGPILAVIDLSRRLGLPPAARDDKSRILVVSSNDEDTGIVVDRVTGVVRIHLEDIRPVPETIEQGSEYLRGIVRKNDRLYILLDREKALGA